MPEENQPASSDKPTVLLVEDDNFITTFLQDKLKDKYNALVATTTAEAETILGQSHVDIIALDLLLPKENGFSLLERLRKPGNPHEKLPVIIVTNYDNKEDIEKAKNLGVEDYLVKADYTPNEIVAKIDHALGRS